MGLLARIFSGRDEHPPPPQPVQVLAQGGRVFALLPSGRLAAWSTKSGDLLWDAQAAGPRIAVQGDRLLDGHGVCRSVSDGQVLWESGQAGLPVSLGERLAILGWQRLWLEGEGGHHALPELDPSPELDTWLHQGRLLGIDHESRTLFWLDPQEPNITLGADGPPIRGGALFGERIVVIRERQGQSWDLELEDMEPLPRWHAQLLAVGPDCSLGVEKRSYRALDHLSSTSWSLSGDIPNAPCILRIGEVIVAETWQGLAICRPGQERPELIELPLGRRQQRPISAHRPIVQSGPQQVALAAWPPLLVDLSTGRRVPVLAPPPPAH